MLDFLLIDIFSQWNFYLWLKNDMMNGSSECPYYYLAKIINNPGRGV